jgi:hypothetical protein
VKSELNKKLKTCRASLSSLGASRDTTFDQTKYLMDIATRFQEVAALALDAKYWRDEIFEQYPGLTLATHIVDRSETFSKSVEMRGHTYNFEVGGTGTKVEQGVPCPLDHDFFATRVIEAHDDIEDILHEKEEISMPLNQGIHEWLTEVYCASRGFELGTFDPSLLAITMREQSKKWNSLALGYVSDAVTIVHNFFTELLRIVCPDARVRRGLISLLTDHLLERYKKAVDQVVFVLQVERSEKPATQNHYFNDTLEKWYDFAPYYVKRILMFV